MTDKTDAEVLLAALVSKPSWKSRNDIGYMVARSWRTSTRSADIQALKRIKLTGDATVLESAADDVAALIGKMSGNLSDLVITTVPCGHSRKPDCFAKLLAMKVADQLRVPFVQIWADRFVDGVSHPKEFEKLSPLEWIEEPTARRVLVVDDVATSGWHIEEALLALRDAGFEGQGFAWIGGTLNGAPKAALTEVKNETYELLKEEDAVELRRLQAGGLPNIIEGELIPVNQRTTIYDRSVTAEILERVAEGESLRSVCLSDLRFPAPSTFRKWCLQDLDGVGDQYAHAAQIGLVNRVERMMEMVDRDNGDVQRDRLRFDAARWYASKMAPKIFGDRLDVTSGGEKLQIALPNGADDIV